MQDETEWLTTKHVAALYNVSPSFVADLANRQGLPVMRLGYRTLRFRREDVEA